jgi:hypothetical protein
MEGAMGRVETDHHSFCALVQVNDQAISTHMETGRDVDVVVW